jgi:hypothetical protein
MFEQEILVLFMMITSLSNPMGVSLFPDKYFSSNQYLLGDTAYTSNGFMVTPFKQPRAKQPHEQTFNTTLSSRRIAIENTLGLLKGRFLGVTRVSIRIRN